ncbi:MAG: APC family permease, partial [Terriglobales bacterium]
LIFAFGGFDNAMFPASEMRDPRRDVPAGLLMGMGVVVVFYLAIQVVFQGVVPPGTVSAQPLAVAAGEFLGRAGAPLMAIGAMISIWGWFAATTLGTPRLTFAMAQHGDLPRQLAAVHPRFRTPHVSILLYVLASWALALAGNFEWNASLSAIARLATYGATCAALPVFRRRTPLHEATWTRPEQSGRALPPSEFRPQPDQREGVLRRAAVPLPVFRVPGGWAAPALGLGFCALLLSQMGRSDFLLLGATLVLGLGSWVAQRRRAD